MTLLLVPICAPTLQQAMADVRRAMELGANGVELRLDLMPDLSDTDVAALAGEVPEGGTVLITLRARDEGGGFDGDDADRVSRLIAVGPWAHWLDVEFETWRRSANIRQKVMLAARRARHVEHDGGRESVDHPGRRRLLLSRHWHDGRPATLTAEVLAMLGESEADAVKIAWTARTIRDNFEALDLLRESPRPMIAICMGPAGLLSRLLARKAGAFAGFAALDDGHSTAPGQVALADLKRLYRWDAIGAATALYGVVGDPIEHSLSPAVHNAAFEAAGVDAVYAPLQVHAGYEPFKAFMVELLARPWLDARGLSITAPHKQNALRFARECGGRIDPLAERIGAVNTLAIGADGALTALNTDAPAVVDALCRGLNAGHEVLRDLRCGVLGAGGAARAAAAALADAGARVTVFARRHESGRALADELDVDAAAWEQRTLFEADAWINATPVGQAPRADESPMPPEALRRGAIVFDTVYHPPVTQLLADAARAGCRTVDGLQMFLTQAELQQQIWGCAVGHAEAMRTAAVARLSRPSS